VTFGPYIGLIALTGVVVGLVAQRLLPGRDRMSIVETVPTAVAVSLLAGLIGWYAVHSRLAGFLLAALVTVGLVHLLRRGPTQNAGAP